MDRTNEFLSIFNILKIDSDENNDKSKEPAEQPLTASIVPSLFLSLAIKSIQLTHENDEIVQRMMKL